MLVAAGQDARLYGRRGRVPLRFVRLRHGIAQKRKEQDKKARYRAGRGGENDAGHANHKPQETQGKEHVIHRPSIIRFKIHSSSQLVRWLPPWKYNSQ